MTIGIQDVKGLTEDTGCHYCRSCLNCVFPKCLEEMTSIELHDFIRNHNLPHIPKRRQYQKRKVKVLV